MEVELTKVSPRGRFEIPPSIMRNARISRSDQFLVYGDENMVIYKKIRKPEVKKSFAELTKKLKKTASEEGFRKNDLEKLIREARAR